MLLCVLYYIAYRAKKKEPPRKIKPETRYELHPDPRIPLPVAAGLRNQRRNGLQAGIGAHHRILPPHRQPPSAISSRSTWRARTAKVPYRISSPRYCSRPATARAFHLAPPAGFPRTHPRRRRDDSQTEGRELRGQTPRQDGRAGTVVLRNDRGTGFSTTSHRATSRSR